MTARNDRDAAERLLAEVIAGERPASDPTVQALLERQPDLRPRLDSLADLGRQLAAIGLEHRGALTDALATPAPGEEVVANRVRDELRAAQPNRFRTGAAPIPKSGTLHRMTWAAVAVAAAVIVGVVFWMQSGGDPVDPDGGDRRAPNYLGAAPSLEGAAPMDGGELRPLDGLTVSVPARIRRFEVVFVHPETGAELGVIPARSSRLIVPEAQLVKILEPEANRVGVLFRLPGGEVIHHATLTVVR